MSKKRSWMRVGGDVSRLGTAYSNLTVRLPVSMEAISKATSLLRPAFSYGNPIGNPYDKRDLRLHFRAILYDRLQMVRDLRVLSSPVVPPGSLHAINCCRPVLSYLRYRPGKRLPTRRLTCRNSHLCPFCWSRAVAGNISLAVFQVIYGVGKPVLDEAVGIRYFPDPEPYSVLFTARLKNYPIDVDIDYMIRDVLSQRGWTKRRNKSVGGYSAVSIEPVGDGYVGVARSLDILKNRSPWPVFDPSWHDKLQSRLMNNPITDHRLLAERVGSLLYAPRNMLLPDMRQRAIELFCRIRKHRKRWMAAGGKLVGKGVAVERNKAKRKLRRDEIQSHYEGEWASKAAAEVARIRWEGDGDDW